MRRFSSQGLLVPPSRKVRHQKGFHWLDCFPWNNYRRQSIESSPVPFLKKYALSLVGLLPFTLFLFSCPQPASNTEPRTAVLLPPADLTILLSYEHRVDLKWTDLNDNETAYVVTRDDKILKTLPANSETFLDETGLEYESDAPNLEGRAAHTYGVYAVDADGTKSRAATINRAKSYSHHRYSELSTNYPRDEIFPEITIDRTIQDVFFKHIPKSDANLTSAYTLYEGSEGVSLADVWILGSVLITEEIMKFSLYDPASWEFRDESGNYQGIANIETLIDRRSAIPDANDFFLPNKAHRFWLETSGESFTTSSFSVDIRHPKTVPLAVRDLAVDISEDTATLTWQAGAVTGNSPEENPAAGFVIQATNKTQDWVTIDYVTSPSFWDTEYFQGSSYRVTAVNNGGIGEYTEITPAG